MTVLLAGEFREFLKRETEMDRLEIRKCREDIRRLAIMYDRAETIPEDEMSASEMRALELFRRYRTSAGDEAPDHIDLHFGDRVPG